MRGALGEAEAGQAQVSSSPVALSPRFAGAAGARRFPSPAPLAPALEGGEGRFQSDAQQTEMAGLG